MNKIMALISNKICLDIINQFTFTIFVCLSLYLLIGLFLKKNVLQKTCLFRLNSESAYSISKIAVEFIYILSVALSVVILLFFTKSIGMFSRNPINLTLKGLNWLSISGFLILIVISCPFRIIFTGKNKLMNIIDFIIILVSNILILAGLIYGSFFYFDYLIN